MRPEQDQTVAALLTEARRGSRDALGALLEAHRNYLTVLARIQIGRRLQGKVDAADLVQDVYVEAHRAFERFEGEAEHSLLAWLRQILAGQLAHLVRRYFGTKARDVRLEQTLEHELADSSQMLDNGLIRAGFRLGSAFAQQGTGGDGHTDPLAI
jgi:RNA polymerase sigma-70 factor (ECF subfamily)